MADRNEDIRRIVEEGRSRGLAPDQVRALVARYDQRTPPDFAVQPDMIPPSRPEDGAPTREAPRLLEDPVDYLATTAGNAVGNDLWRTLGETARGLYSVGSDLATASSPGMVLSPEGAEARGRLGTMAREAVPAVIDHYKESYGSLADLERSVRDRPVGTALDLTGIGGIASTARRVSAPFVTAAGRAAYRGGVRMVPANLRREFPDLAETGFREGVPLTEAGADAAADLLRGSADDAAAVVHDASGRATREAVERAGTRSLPPGRVAVPTGEPPVPQGGRPALLPAHEMQPRRTGPAANADELLTRRHDPVYGPSPARPPEGRTLPREEQIRLSEEAIPDAYPSNLPGEPGGSPGVVHLTDDALTADQSAALGRTPPSGPYTGGPVGAVSAEQALKYVDEAIREAGTGVLGQNEGLREGLVTLQREALSGRQWPSDLNTAQGMKRFEQEMAQTIYRAAERDASIPMQARRRFAEAVAKGIREGIEEQVAALGNPTRGGRTLPEINARTQELIGLERAAQRATENRHIASRTAAATTGAAIGTGVGGVPGALIGAGTGALLGTPQGLTKLGLLLKRGAGTGSTAGDPVRAALISQMLLRSHGEEPQE